MVHSYHETYPSSGEDKDGFVKGLFKGGFVLDSNYELKEMFMNTKTENNTPEKIENIGLLKKEAVLEFNPDILICLDDNAFFYVCRNLLHQFPIIFWGINSKLSSYNDTNHHFLKDESYGINATGAHEPIFLGNMISFWIKIGEQLDGGTIKLIYDSTTTGNASYIECKEELKERTELNYLNFEYQQISTINDLKGIINEVNTNDTIKVLFPMVYSLFDENSKTSVSVNDIYPLISSTTTTPTLLTQVESCAFGLLFGIVQDRESTGKIYGKYVSRILNNENKVDDFALITSKDIPSLTLINTDTSKKLGYEFSDSLLSFFDQIHFKTETTDQTWINFLIITILVFIITISLALLVLLMMMFFIIARINKKREEELNEICTLVSFMELNKPPIQKLLKKNQKTGLEKKLANIVGNLQLFVPFVPKNVICNVNMKYNSSSQTETEETSTTSSSFSASSDLQSLYSSSKTSNANDDYEITKKLNGESSLEWRIVSVLRCKLHGMVPALQYLQAWYVKKLVNKFIEIVDANITNNKGIIQNFRGDIITASFNDGEILENHFKKACTGGCGIIKEWKEYIKKTIEKDSVPDTNGKKLFVNSKGNIDLLKNINCIVSVESFHQLIGAIGSENSKFFCSLARNIQKKEDNKLVRMNAKYGTEILIDSLNMESIKYHFNYRYIDKVKFLDKETIICTITPKKQTEEDWLLLAENNAEQTNQFKTYNESFVFYQNGQYQKAKDLLHKCRSENQDDIFVHKLLTKVNEKIENGEDSE